MSPIADAIYQVLRIRTPKPVARKALISYAEAVAEIFRYPEIPSDLNHHGDPRVDAALLEITTACQAGKQPLITALVLEPGGKFTPPEAYFASAHPAAKTPEAKTAAWEKELREVVMTFYPSHL